VASSATPVLFICAGIVLATAAIVPAFLSIGETALVQQREFEDADKISSNQFAQQRASDKVKKSQKKF
jgi:hypothetical protein